MNFRKVLGASLRQMFVTRLAARWFTVALFSFCLSVAIVMPTGAARAFDNHASSAKEFDFGGCTVSSSVIGPGPWDGEPMAPQAHLAVASNDSAYYSGGSRIETSWRSENPITSSVIADCLGVDSAEVLDLRQVGPNSYADNFIGFSFNLKTAAGELDAGPHAYVIRDDASAEGKIVTEHLIGNEALSAVAINVRPIAVSLVAEQTVASGATVTLDGSGSNDPDGSIASVSWTQDPNQIQVELNDGSGFAKKEFTAPTLAPSDQPTTLTFYLSVKDSSGFESEPAKFTVHVNPPIPLEPQSVSFMPPLPQEAKVGATLTIKVGSSNPYNAVVMSVAPESNGICALSDNASSAGIASATVSYLAVGECTLLADQAANETHAAAPQAKLEFEISPAAPPLAPAISSISPTAGTTLGNQIITISGENLAEANVTMGGEATAVQESSATSLTVKTPSHAAGTVDVIVSTQAGEAKVVGGYNYTLAPQTITFNSTPPSDAVIGGSTYTIAATASSSLSVEFTSAYESVCTVSGSTVSFSAVGTCVINANQPGDATIYAAATQVQQFFAVIAPASNDATLKALTVSAGSLTPGFSAGTTSYSTAVLADVASVTVTPTANEGHAKIKVNTIAVNSGAASGSITLTAGQSTAISVAVTAEDGTTTRTYTIAVTRPVASADSTLKSLSFANSTRYPVDFDPAITSYTFTANGNMSLTPTVNATGATILFDGQAYSSGSIISAVSVGTTHTIVVTAPNGNNTTTYNITTRNISSDTALRAVTISQGNLSPTFSATTYGYAVQVPNSVTSLTVTPTANDAPFATVKVKNMSVGPGEASGSIALIEGPNSIPVVVTAQNGGNTKTTIITVTRAGPPSWAEMGLTTPPATLNPGTTSLALRTQTSGVTAVTYDATPSDVCAVSGSTLSFFKAGTCAITPTVQSDPPQAVAVANVTLPLAENTIAFGALAETEIGTPAPMLGATATSGLPVSYVSTTASVCKLDSVAITIVAVGECSITASQAGDAFTSAATPVVQAFIVKPKAAISAVDAGLDLPAILASGTTAFTLPAATLGGTAVSYSASPADICNVAGSALSFLKAGQCLLTPTVQSTPAQPVTPVNVSLPLGKNIIVKLGIPDAEIGSTVTYIEDTATSGLKVSFDSEDNAICTVLGNVISFNKAGTCSIIGSQPGNAFYAAAESVNWTIRVTAPKLQQIITFNALSDVKFGDPVHLTFSTDAVGLTPRAYSETTDVCDVSGLTGISMNKIGRCTIRVTQNGNDTYNAAQGVSQSFTISRGTQSAFSISANPASIKVSERSSLGTDGGSGSGDVTYEITDGTANCSLSDITVTGSAVGQCTITATKSGGDRYDDITDTTSITIAAKVKLPQKITLNAPKNTTYSAGEPATVTVTAFTDESGLSVELDATPSDVCGVQFSNVVSILKPGTCFIKATQDGNDDYEAAQPATVSFDIAKAQQDELIVYAEPSTLFPGESTDVRAHAGSGDGLVTYEITAGSDYCGLDDDKVTAVKEGECTVKATKAEDDYYAATSGEVKITVSAPVKAAQSIIFEKPEDVTYSPNAEITLSASTGEGGQTVSLASTTTDICTINSSNMASITKPGTCTITASQEGDDTHEAALSVTQSFTIAKMSQQISFTGLKDVTFSPGLIVQFTATASSELLPSVSFTGSCTGGTWGSIKITGIGECTVTANEGGDDYFESATASQTFKVKAPNTAPVANAGSDQDVKPASTVTLDGSKSSDEDENDALSYEWKQVGGADVELSSTTDAQPQFTAPATGTFNEYLKFKLTVADQTGATSEAEVTITVEGTAATEYSIGVSVTIPNLDQMNVVTIQGDLRPLVQKAERQTYSPFMFAAASPVMKLMQLAAADPVYTITFYDNGKVIPGCEAVLVSNNQAKCTTLIAPGQHTFSATYSKNGEVQVAAVSNTEVVAVVDKPGPNATAAGSFLSDRANQIVSNLFDMGRGEDRLNEAAGNETSVGNFSDDVPPKTDLPQLGFGGKLATSTGPLIQPAAMADAPSGMEDLWGLQAMLRGAMQNAGQSGSMDRFSYSGAFDASVDAHDGFAASFHTSLSQIMKFNEKLEQQQASGMGFSRGASHSSSLLDVWVEGTYAGYNGNRSGQFGLFSIGSDYVLNPNLLIGVFAQIDSMNQTSGTGVSGTGWMAGPYATARLQDNLFLNARAAWGTSANTLGGNDKFNSTRWLVSGSLTGKLELTNALTLSPEFGFTYFQDNAGAYTSTMGFNIPAVRTELGQFKFAPNLVYVIATDGGYRIEPSITPELIWNFASTNVDGQGVLSGTATGPVGLRGRIKAGMAMRTPSGASISAYGSYDGIGSGSYSSLAAQAQLSVPLN